MVKLKCGNCGKVWPYKGNNKVFATCPDCRKLNNIQKSKVNGGQKK